jgi:hypothetical protein
MNIEAQIGGQFENYYLPDSLPNSVWAHISATRIESPTDPVVLKPLDILRLPLSDDGSLTFYPHLKEWAKKIQALPIPTSPTELQSELAIESPVTVIRALETAVYKADPQHHVEVDFLELVQVCFDLSQKFPNFAMLLHLFHTLKFLEERKRQTQYSQDMMLRIQQDNKLSSTEEVFLEEMQSELNSLILAVEYLGTYLQLLVRFLPELFTKFDQYLNKKIALFEHLVEQCYVRDLSIIETRLSIEERIEELIQLTRLKDYISKDFPQLSSSLLIILQQNISVYLQSRKPRASRVAPHLSERLVVQRLIAQARTRQSL